MLVSVVGPASPSSSCDIYICATTLSATQVTTRGSDRVTDDDFTVAVANLKNPVIMDEVGVIGAVPCTRLDVSAAAAVTATVCSDSINANIANLSPCQFIDSLHVLVRACNEASHTYNIMQCVCWCLQ